MCDLHGTFLLASTHQLGELACRGPPVGSHHKHKRCSGEFRRKRYIGGRNWLYWPPCTLNLPYEWNTLILRGIHPVGSVFLKHNELFCTPTRATPPKGVWTDGRCIWTQELAGCDRLACADWDVVSKWLAPAVVWKGTSLCHLGSLELVVENHHFLKGHHSTQLSFILRWHYVSHCVHGSGVFW